MITRAIQEAPNKQVAYRVKKKMIREAKINQMRAKREKSEMQAIAKEKKKEELDAVLSQYGGLWRCVHDMVNNMSERNQKEKKAALTAQIKYRKVVIGTKVNDKKLLQLSSNRKDFSVPELEQNLRSILGNLNPDSAFKSTSSVYRQVEERREFIDEYVAKKRKVVNATEDEQGKIQRLEHKTSWEVHISQVGQR